MIRVASISSPFESTADGLRVYLEGDSRLALTSPEAQRLVFNYAKSAGFNDYGLNKFVEMPENITSNETFSQRGYWLLLPSQWNRNQVKV